jgi:hypothetical protein
MGGGGGGDGFDVFVLFLIFSTCVLLESFPSFFVFVRLLGVTRVTMVSMNCADRCVERTNQTGRIRPFKPSILCQRRRILGRFALMGVAILTGTEDILSRVKSNNEARRGPARHLQLSNATRPPLAHHLGSGRRPVADPLRAVCLHRVRAVCVKS